MSDEQDTAAFVPPTGWEEHHVKPSEMRAGDVFERVTASDSGGVRQYVVWRAPAPLTLPTEVGTVIAIGGWRFVLVNFIASSPAWVLLPAATVIAARSMDAANFRVGAGYAPDMVLAEAEQERGGFTVVASPTATRAVVAAEVIDFFEQRSFFETSVEEDVEAARAKWGVS